MLKYAGHIGLVFASVHALSLCLACSAALRWSEARNKWLKVLSFLQTLTADIGSVKFSNIWQSAA